MRGGGGIKPRAAETIKNAAIALLTISAIIFGWRTVVSGTSADPDAISEFFAQILGGGRAPGRSGDEARESPADERPLCIVITNESGERFGAKYDAAQLELVYGRTSSVFGEAFSSASGFGPADAGEWRGALDRPGIYYAYPSGVSIEMLDAWFGTNMSPVGGASELDVRRMCVAFGRERDRLLFQDAAGGFYGADTASLGEQPQIVGLFGGNGARFAFETDNGRSDPYAVLMPDAAHPVIAAANPMSDSGNLDAVLAELGISNQLNSSYTDADGTTVFVSNTFTFSLDGNGDAVYRRTASAAQPASERERGQAAAVTAARAAADGILAGVCGDAALVLAGVAHAEQDAYIVSFAYSVAGGSIYVGGDGSAAEATVKDGVVTEMALVFRQYAITGETVPLLPERQAYAAAGGEFELCYFDSGGELLAPEWVVFKG
ncbi:MAG: hypothetical protein LBJ84_01450 [Oscillospiraceae bacterium]|jgi:hypothetical protein|nr:hypothetical protein [Oscillospiraceae bacterium]